MLGVELETEIEEELVDVVIVELMGSFNAPKLKLLSEAVPNRGLVAAVPKEKPPGRLDSLAGADVAGPLEPTLEGDPADVDVPSKLNPVPDGVKEKALPT